MTAATAPGAARGRAREGASRRKELEDDPGRKAGLIGCLRFKHVANDGADEACAMLRISRDAMYRLAKDPDDPFPIRYIGGKTRDGIVLHDELVAWVERNSVVGSPRRG